MCRLALGAKSRTPASPALAPARLRRRLAPLLRHRTGPSRSDVSHVPRRTEADLNGLRPHSAISSSSQRTRSLPQCFTLLPVLGASRPATPVIVSPVAGCSGPSISGSAERPTCPVSGVLISALGPSTQRSQLPATATTSSLVASGPQEPGRGLQHRQSDATRQGRSPLGEE
jgi:hypothetical protein